MAPSAFASTTGATVTAASQPTVLDGGNSQPGGNLTIDLPNTFAIGDTITYTVAPPAGANCSATGVTVGFAATPTVTVSGGGGTGQTAPTITPSLSSSTACSGKGVNDVLTLLFTNAATGTGTTHYTLTVSGISYNVGSAAGTGVVTGTVGGSGGTTGTPSDAYASVLGVAANNPAVGVDSTATSAAISNVVLTEAAAGTVPANDYVCVTLSGTNAFTPTDKPTVTASGGGATVTSPATISATGSTASFQVTKASATTPATFTISGLTVDATKAGGNGPVTIQVIDSASSTCTTALTTYTSTAGVRAFSVLSTSRTAGADAPGTAVAEFEAAYPPTGTSCPAKQGNDPGGSAVLARYDLFPDALSGSYVAGKLGTGILLTNTSSLSSVTQTALRLEGISTVYVMGGPLAVSDAVVSQIEALPVYNCGGTSTVTNGATGAPYTIRVVRVAGTDRYGTSEAAAEYFGSASGVIGTLNVSGAYGVKTYNDTTGSASTSGPTSAVPTAVVATGQNFRDAVSSSVVADSLHLPMILTTQASLSSEAAAALTNDGIKQVIVVGGPLAVSDAVVTSIEGMNISVLRIAGNDGTDTAQLLARFELNTTTGNVGLGWAPNNGTSKGNNVYLARGDFYPDALAGSALAAVGGPAHAHPILLTESPTSLGTYTTAFLNTGGQDTTGNGIDGLNTTADESIGQVFSVDVLGGPLAVSSTTQQDALNAVAQG